MRNMLEIGNSRKSLISNDLIDCFKEPIVIFSEANRLFDWKQNVTREEMPQYKRKTTVSYNPLPQIHFVEPIYKILREDIPYVKNNSCFILLQSDSSTRRWLLFAPYSIHIYDENELSFQTFDYSDFGITSGKKTLGKNKIRLHQRIKDKNYRKDYYNQVLNSETHPFFLFMQSFVINKHYPEYTLVSFNFYQQILLDFQFLVHFAESAYDSNKNNELIPVWLAHVGKNFPLMYKFLVWHNFQKLNEKNMVMRSNNFFVSLTTYIVGSDKGFRDFIQQIDLSSETLIEDFLVAFEELEFSSQTSFMLHILYEEAERRFPGQSACRFAISGVLFLRLFSSQILERQKNLAKNIRPLIPIYNMTVGAADEALILRVVKTIDKFRAEPRGFVVHNSAIPTLDEGKVLLDHIASKAADYMRAVEDFDFVEEVDKFLARGKIVYQTPINELPVI